MIQRGTKGWVNRSYTMALEDGWFTVSGSSKVDDLGTRGGLRSKIHPKIMIVCKDYKTAEDSTRVTLTTQAVNGSEGSNGFCDFRVTWREFRLTSQPL